MSIRLAPLLYTLLNGKDERPLQHYRKILQKMRERLHQFGIKLPWATVLAAP